VIDIDWWPFLLKIVFHVQWYIVEFKFNTSITVTHSTPNVQQSDILSHLPFLWILRDDLAVNILGTVIFPRTWHAYYCSILLAHIIIFTSFAQWVLHTCKTCSTIGREKYIVMIQIISACTTVNVQYTNLYHYLYKYIWYTCAMSVIAYNIIIVVRVRADGKFGGSGLRRCGGEELRCLSPCT
jgi:hypothetical protein